MTNTKYSTSAPSMNFHFTKGAVPGEVVAEVQAGNNYPLKRYLLTRGPIDDVASLLHNFYSGLMKKGIEIINEPAFDFGTDGEEDDIAHARIKHQIIRQLELNAIAETKAVKEA